MKLSAVSTFSILHVSDICSQSISSLGSNCYLEFANDTYIGILILVYKFIHVNHGYFCHHLYVNRATYKDGMMEHEPKACAAVKGTQIMVWS